MCECQKRIGEERVMKIAIVAVAGVSSRFNEGMEDAVLKCIYATQDARKTLLYAILKKCVGYDSVVLVGGYQYEALEAYVRAYEQEFPFAIHLVYNAYYQNYGTGYTLKVGLDACREFHDCEEITLIEGDLFFDEASFSNIKKANRSVATYNYAPISSRKAVIAYVNEAEKLKYVFSTSHGSVKIAESFFAIYNSGQVWKFADMLKLENAYREITAEDWKGTNLILIEKYFEKLSLEEYELLPFAQWENCNTREDLKEYEDLL